MIGFCYVLTAEMSDCMRFGKQEYRDGEHETYFAVQYSDTSLV